MFGTLESISSKPDVFSVYTAADLWTDEYLSARMLEFHLNEDVDLSSRNTRFIDASVSWMSERFSLDEGSRIIDFGCGPGLYTSRFAKLGAQVEGIDFSPRSIAYARRQAAESGNQATYTEANYLAFEPEAEFDLITMIMCDYCALSPVQRTAMLQKFRRLLAPEGRIVLDAYSLSAFESKQEDTVFAKGLMDGFWSPEPYFGFLVSFKYDVDKVSLDKYTIIERDDIRVIYNWLQHFSLESFKSEVDGAGLEVEEILGDVAGHPYDAGSPEFAAVLKSP